MTPLAPVLEIALAVLVTVAAVFDIRSRRIPNWLVVSGLCTGVLLNTWLCHLDGLTCAGLGAVLAFAVYFPLFALRVMGAGDVKLMIAAGAFVGPRNWLMLLLFTTLAGGILAVVVLLVRGGLTRTLRNVLLILGQLVRLNPPHEVDPKLDIAHKSAVTLPHAVSIAIGALTWLAWSHIQ